MHIGKNQYSDPETGTTNVAPRKKKKTLKGDFILHVTLLRQ